MIITILFCGDCGRGTIYARERCYECYRRWWRINTDMPIKHGTYSAYVNRKCRCELCRAAKRDYAAAYRERTKAKRDDGI